MGDHLSAHRTTALVRLFIAIPPPVRVIPSTKNASIPATNCHRPSLFTRGRSTEYAAPDFSSNRPAGASLWAPGLTAAAQSQASTTLGLDTPAILEGGTAARLVPTVDE